MVAEVTSRRAKRRRHLAELLLYTVMVPALTILTSPLGVHLDYCTSQTGLGDDNRVRLPAPPPPVPRVCFALATGLGAGCPTPFKSLQVEAGFQEENPPMLIYT